MRDRIKKPKQNKTKQKIQNRVNTELVERRRGVADRLASNQTPSWRRGGEGLGTRSSATSRGRLLSLSLERLREGGVFLSEKPPPVLDRRERRGGGEMTAKELAGEVEWGREGVRGARGQLSPKLWPRMAMELQYCHSTAPWRARSGQLGLRGTSNSSPTGRRCSEIRLTYLLIAEEGIWKFIVRIE